MSVILFFLDYSLADENYKYHTYNKSLIANKFHFFYIFDSYFMPIKNNDLNFDLFIINYKTISHMSTFNIVKKR